MEKKSLREIIYDLYLRWDPDRKLLNNDYLLAYVVWLLTMQHATYITMRNPMYWNSERKSLFTNQLIAKKIPFKAIERTARKVREEVPEFKINTEREREKYRKEFSPKLF